MSYAWINIYDAQVVILVWEKACRPTAVAPSQISYSNKRGCLGQTTTVFL